MARAAAATLAFVRKLAAIAADEVEAVTASDTGLEDAILGDVDNELPTEP